MKTFIVTPLEITKPTDTRAIERAVKWLRDWTNDSDLTSRYALEEVDAEGEPTGKWLVTADDRAQSPMTSETVSEHATESEAKSEADRLNAEIDAKLRGYILEDKIELPDEVDFLYLGSVVTGRPYPQSRRVTVSVRYQHAEVGPVEFEITCRWSSRFVAEDRDVHTAEVAKQVAADFSEALQKAVDARRAELSDEEN